MRKKLAFLNKVAAVVALILLISAVPTLQTGQAQEKPELLKFVRTVQVTPDDNFGGGGFARVSYVPALDRVVVVFRAQHLVRPAGGCMDSGHAYKEYTLDMQETGEFGVFNCEVADSGGLMVDNTYYDVSMHAEAGSPGWQIGKYDAVTWEKLASIFFPLDVPREVDSDPMVAVVNGQLDISSQYNEAGHPPAIEQGGATFHQFFSADLEFLGKKILTDTPHINGSSLIQVDDTIYFISADAFSGDVIVMEYDKDWNYLGMKKLIAQGHWSMGIAFDGQRFYLAYMDTSLRSSPAFLPVSLNVHLAIFDRDWNLIEDVAVTNYTRADYKQPGRPWVLLHGNYVYVSYDLDTIDPTTKEEQGQWQAVVSMYEFVESPGE